MDYLSLVFSDPQSFQIRDCASVDSTNLGLCSTAGFTTENPGISGPAQFKALLFKGQLWTIYMENIHFRLRGPFGSSFMKTHGTSLEIQLPSSVRTSPWQFLWGADPSDSGCQSSFPRGRTLTSLWVVPQESSLCKKEHVVWSVYASWAPSSLPPSPLSSHLTGLCSWTSAPTPKGPWGQVCILTVPTSVYFQFSAWA